MEIKRFGRIREVIPLPPLTEIQVESYKRALQADVPPDKREDVGIQAAFKETFPVEEGDKGKGWCMWRTGGLTTGRCLGRCWPWGRSSVSYTHLTLPTILLV